MAVLIRSPSENVIQAVSRHTDTGPLELPPLYQAVDPDALNDLVANSTDALDAIQFTYAGHSVTVQGDGTVTIGDHHESRVTRPKTATDD